MNSLLGNSNKINNANNFGNQYNPKYYVGEMQGHVKRHKYFYSAALLAIPLIVFIWMGIKHHNMNLVYTTIALLITVMILIAGIAFKTAKLPHIVLLLVLIIIEIGFIIYFLRTLKISTNRHMYINFYNGNGDGESLFYYEGRNRDRILELMKGTNYAFAMKEDMPVELGTEGTYSFWLKVCPDNFNRGNRKWRTVWYRGNDTGDNLYKMKTPGVYLAPTNNKLIITVACENGPDEGNAITLDDIPLNEWFCVTIVLDGRALDVYMNGLLERSISLTGSPLIMNTNVIKGVNGFNGLIAFFRYSMSALVPRKIKELYERELVTIERNKYDLETCVNE